MSLLLALLAVVPTLEALASPLLTHEDHIRRQASTYSDPAFSVPLANLSSSVTCPRGITGAAGGVVLLVHGTASTGAGTWQYGPYNTYLPYAEPGFDVCWIDLPNQALGDAQISAEYVAYQIPILAKQSATGQIAIVGHSQGAGCTPQWALDFWPSTRQYVSDYVALAGDFHGTNTLTLSCTTEELTTGGCHYALLQQTAGSNYLKAQTQRGGSALVTTTSIYSIYDGVVEPETGTNPSSFLPGAMNIQLQNSSVCGSTHVVTHFQMVTDAAVYNLAYDALTHAGPASIDRFQNTYCSSFANQTSLSMDSVSSKLQNSFIAGIGFFTPFGPEARSMTEPALMPYVCEQGQATVCGS